MDPKETLKELRQLAQHITTTADGIDNYTDRLVLHDLTEEAENMATLFTALDEWMGKGGFSPWPKTIWNSDGTDGPVLICPPPS